MNNFTKSELVGRELLLMFLKNRNTSVTFIEGAYDVYDAFTDNSIIEIKVRNVSSTQYPDFILEKHKVDEMLKLKGNKQALYCNFFNDGKVAFWYVDRVAGRYPINKKLCRRTTAYNSDYVNKDVYLIKLSDAAVFNY